MRLRKQFWFGLCLVIVAGAIFLLLTPGERDTNVAPAAGAGGSAIQTSKLVARLGTSDVSRPDDVLSSRFSVISTNSPGLKVSDGLAYRLSNTRESLGSLVKSERGVLLRNALIDTGSGEVLDIPAHLKSAGEPGSYIVQAAGAITASFRDQLTRAGAEIVSYVPNNAFLVRGSEAVAARLRGAAGVQAVLPFEPYYKLDGRLLGLAVRQELSPYGELNVVSFPGQAQKVKAQLEKIGATVVRAPERTPLGDILVAKVPADAVAQVAQMAEVHMVGVHFDKRPVNDLSRLKVRISTNAVTAPPPSHYAANVASGLVNLTGQGVLVAVADTGVDDSHPDIAGRVFGFVPDFDGHGTHVIGSLLGDGSMSSTVGSPNGTNSHARGSTNGANFSGSAPAARAFVQDLELPDALLQERTALTNALISNNSWGFPDSNDYDIFAASYDAAVRDSLPGVTGEQEVAYVFAAGNSGGGGGDGLNGIPGSIVSPATAKNVVSVGTVDQARFITNFVERRCRDETNVVNGTNVSVRICETNQPWLGETDSDNQVAPSSSRGNVGIGIEGPFGRIKPDVVAPGSMTVSLRSANWEEPNGSTNTFPFRYNSVTIAANATNLYALNIPREAVRLRLVTVTNQFSPTNMMLLIGADIDNIPTTALATNDLTLDLTTLPALRQGTLYYTIANPFHSNTVIFDLVLLLTVTNDVGNYYDELRRLNAPLKPHYRYESGSSMAAPKISGMMALFQEYLGTNFNLRPSPALLKALVINGARSLSQNYNLDSHPPVNHQGWGIANISNSIPSGLAASVTNGPMRFFDQNLTNALSTGGTHVYQVSVPDEAKSYPLRMTLVWTDPPGNPVSSLKIVNDLNMVVTGDATTVLGQGTNSTTTNTSSLLWVGNNFPPGSDFTQPLTVSSTDTNALVSTNLVADLEAARDVANNVENIYIRPPLSSSYTVVVKGHRVNVNAVNSHSNAIGQDYALVISSGNVAPSNSVNLIVTGPAFTNDASPRLAGLVPAVTNGTFASLFNQRVGANSPLIVSTNGATNQWCFFTYTNVTRPNFRYVAVITFLAPELSWPRTNDADIDLYVLNGSAGFGTNLFVLDPAAVSASRRSLTRGGTEFVVFSNASPGEVFYIGVKSEDQQAAMFSIVAASSDKPFSSRDASNNVIAVAFPLPADIPDGTPDTPGGTNLLALVLEPEVTVQRLYVTNTIYHEEAGDLIGILSHTDPKGGGDAAATLNNHRTWNGFDTTIYDDSDQGDLGDLTSTPPVAPSDGPGSLRDFVGHGAAGVWQYAISDNALFHTGRVDNLTLVIEPASTNSDLPVDLTRTIGVGRWLYAAFDVPADATNIHACVSYLSGSGPVELYLRRGDFPDRATFDKGLTGILPPGDCLDLGDTDSPPLSRGRYYVGVHNASPLPVTIRLTVAVQRSLQPNRAQTIANNDLMNLIDDATTNSTLFVTNRGLVTGVEVDVRLNHPRVSDLALHLVNPQGQRILLAENRGRDTTNGYGWTSSNIVVTNFGMRVLDSSFEGTGTVTILRPQIYGGWRIDAGDIEALDWQPGRQVNAHTGTNIIDINGTAPGTISTNVTLIAGRSYLLSFAYSRNPDAGAAQAQVSVGNVAAVTVTSPAPTPWNNLQWISTSIVFRATSVVNRLEVRAVSWPQPQTGVLFDTFRIDEVELVTNSTFYVTFTDDPAKALDPIKFAVPPFGETNFRGTNIFISGFEGAVARAYTVGNTFVGWNVRSNTVNVRSNSVYAYSHTNYLLLRKGTISRVLPTIRGKEYVLQFATRTFWRPIYSTGVDEDAAPVALEGGEIDPHYYVSSNSVTRTTNFAYLQLTNAPPMGNSWINRSLPDSRWIGIDGTNLVLGNQYYGFKTHFDLTGYDWRTVSLTGNYMADGPAVYVLLNGVNMPLFTVGQPQEIGNTSYRTGFETRTMTSGFIRGINTLELVITNTGPPVLPLFNACGIQINFAADAIRGQAFGSLSFDNLPTVPIFGGGFVPIPNGYQGFQWDNFGAIDGLAQNPAEGYYQGVVSPRNVAFNRAAVPASISRATPFTLDSAYLTSAFDPTLRIRAEGYVGASLVYDNTYDVVNSGPTLINFGYRGITRVTFTTITVGGSENHFAMDGLLIDSVTPPIHSAVGQVKLIGSYTNYFTGLSDAWRMQNATFVARSNITVLEFTGIDPGIVLDHIQIRDTGKKYYFPEEPLAPLVGSSAHGPWKLEVWDSRLGALASGSDLISWRLNFNYVRTNPPVVRLTNHVPFVGTVFTNNLRYFVVNVPCDTATVTNTLMSLTPPGLLNLLFNQNAFPTGAEPGDVELISNTSSNISVLSVGTYPLTRRGPYLLAVRNSNPAQNNDFLLRVDIDCAGASSPFSPFVIPKSVTFGPNGFTLKWFAEPGAQFNVQYTDDLSLHWNSVPQVFVSETGEFSFSDDGTLTGGLSPQRFYRLLLQ